MGHNAILHLSHVNWGYGPWKCSALCLYTVPGLLKRCHLYIRNTSEWYLAKRAPWWSVCDFYIRVPDLKTIWNLCLIYACVRSVLFTLPTLQVKFQSFLLLSGLHETQQILTGAGSQSVQWILTFSFQLGCVSRRLPAEGPSVSQCCFFFLCVCVRVCAFEPTGLETWGVCCCCFWGSCSSNRAAALILW